jgi:hypothetical protein
MNIRSKTQHSKGSQNGFNIISTRKFLLYQTQDGWHIFFPREEMFRPFVAFSATGECLRTFPKRQAFFLRQRRIFLERERIERDNTTPQISFTIHLIPKTPNDKDLASQAPIELNSLGQVDLPWDPERYQGMPRMMGEYLFFCVFFQLPVAWPPP